MNIPIDISHVKLKTKRTILRSWKYSDLYDFYQYAKMEEIGKMAGWKPHESPEETAIVLKDFIDKKNTFAIEIENKVVGSIGIEKYEENLFPEFSSYKCREIGYALSKEMWGQGIMPEVLNEVVRYLFQEKQLDVIICGHFLSNLQSKRVQEKCGFMPYKLIPYQTQIGTIEDSISNVLYYSEWIKMVKSC